MPGAAGLLWDFVGWLDPFLSDVQCSRPGARFTLSGVGVGAGQRSGDGGLGGAETVGNRTVAETVGGEPTDFVGVEGDGWAGSASGSAWAIGLDGGERSLVFPNLSGGVRQPGTIREELAKMLAGTEWDRVHTHVMRKTVATILA
jgi:hypothetical protein